MTIPLDSIPRFTAAEALAVAKREYGIGGPISRLPSERDQNFLIDDPQRGKMVLKIANLHDEPDLLQCQNLAMHRVASSPVTVAYRKSYLHDREKRSSRPPCRGCGSRRASAQVGRGMARENYG